MFVFLEICVFGFLMMNRVYLLLLIWKCCKTCLVALLNFVELFCSAFHNLHKITLFKKTYVMISFMGLNCMVISQKFLVLQAH